MCCDFPPSIIIQVFALILETSFHISLVFLLHLLIFEGMGCRATPFHFLGGCMSPVPMPLLCSPDPWSIMMDYGLLTQRRPNFLSLGMIVIKVVSSIKLRTMSILFLRFASPFSDLAMVVPWLLMVVVGLATTEYCDKILADKTFAKPPPLPTTGMFLPVCINNDNQKIIYSCFITVLGNTCIIVLNKKFV